MKKRMLLQGLCAASVLLTVACQPSASVPSTSPAPGVSPSSTTSPTPTSSTSPTGGPSASPAPGSPVVSPSPSASIPPAVVESSNVVLDAPEGAPVVALSDVKSIVISGDRFLNNGKGSSTLLKVSLKDAAGTVVTVKNVSLIFESLDPTVFSVSANGTVTALKDFGSGRIQVTEPTTGLSAALDFSVSSGTITSSGGGGGGGGSTTVTPTPTPSPTPSSSLNLSLSYNGLGLDVFRVNTSTDGAQKKSKVAVDAAGNYVVVWESMPTITGEEAYDACGDDYICFNTVSQNNRLSGADGDGSGIIGQRFRADGVPLGAEFQVNSFTRDDIRNTHSFDGTAYFELNGQDTPDIAMNASGQFVVVWESHEQDGDVNGVFAQRYNAGGQPVGGEFQVNTTSAGEQDDPSVAIRDDGSFVVAWTHNADDNEENTKVHYRAFTADGNPVSDSQAIGTYNTNEVHIAASSSGEVTIAWEDDDFNIQNVGPASIIKFQRLNNSSIPIGNVGSVTHDNSVDSFDVAYLANNQLVFGWESSNDAYFNIYNSSNAAIFAEGQRASTASSDEVDHVSITSNGTDHFALSWDSDEITSNDSIYSRIFSYSNAVLSSTPEVQVSQNISGDYDNDNDSAHLAMASNGDLVIVWDTQEHPEDIVYGVFGKLLTKNGDIK